jgi:hypothetical protein
MSRPCGYSLRGYGYIDTVFVLRSPNALYAYGHRETPGFLSTGARHMKIPHSKSTLVTSLVFATLVFSSVTTWAQGTAQQRSACIGDAFKFCSADIPNVSKVEACLSQDRSKLDPACAAEFQPTGKTELRRSHFR